jgi:alpha-tubulin suppressor-like RCC1 family protein
MHHQLGLGVDESFIQEPMCLQAFSGRVTKISCGSQHAIALLDDGTVYTWGKLVGNIQETPQVLKHLRSECVWNITAHVTSSFIFCE